MKGYNTMKLGTKFNITYYAKKHKEFITRKGNFDDKSKFWSSTKGTPLFTYFDNDNQGYRCATGTWTIKVIE